MCSTSTVDVASRKELLDFLHQSLLSSSTGCLYVVSEEHNGKLYIEDGRLVHAECPSFLGEEALWILLRAEPDQLEFENNVHSPKKTIVRPTELILMESAVHVDQPERIGVPAPPEKVSQNLFRITSSVNFDGDEENGKKLYILGIGETTVGRSNGNDLVIGDKTVSRHHATIYVDEKTVKVVDLGGRNGTRLNNSQVRQAILKNNDTICFGMVILKFFWSNNGEPILVQEPLKSPVNKAPTGPIKLPPSSS